MKKIIINDKNINKIKKINEIIKLLKSNERRMKADEICEIVDISLHTLRAYVKYMKDNKIYIQANRNGYIINNKQKLIKINTTTEEEKEKILKLIDKNGKITRKEVNTVLKLGYYKTEKLLDELKENGIIDCKTSLGYFRI